MSKGRKVKLSSVVQDTITGEWGTECTNEKICTKVLRTTNFTNTGVIDYSNVVLRNIPEKKRNAKRLIDQDIILEKSGGSDTQPVGRVVFFSDKSDEVYLCNNFTQILRIDQSKAYPKFIFWHLYYLHLIGTTEELQNKTTGIRNLQIKRYMSQEIHLPPLSAQKNIAHRLEHINSLIDMRKEQIDKLDLLVKSRFIEMFRNDYPYVILGDEFETKSGGTPSRKKREFYDGGTIPWLTSGEVNKGIINETENCITEEGLKNSSAKWIPKNSVVIAMYGATAGKVGLLRLRTTTNQAICAVLPHKDFVPEYLYYAIKSQELWMVSNVIGGAQPNLSQTIIRKMQIMRPPLAKQETFACFLQQIDKAKFTIQKSLEELKTLKHALMQQYFG